MDDASGLQPKGRGERTRQKVLEAALSVVTEHPLAEVQLQQIAQRAGISPGHVLYHFGSKDQILVETLRWSEDRIAAQREEELTQLDDPVRRLERWTALFLPHGADDPTWKLWLEFWLRSASTNGPEGLLGDASNAWLRDLDSIVIEGIERGVFLDVDRRSFAVRAHALLVGLSIGVLVGWQQLDDAQRVALESMAGELGCVFPSLNGPDTRGRQG